MTNKSILEGWEENLYKLVEQLTNNTPFATAEVFGKFNFILKNLLQAQREKDKQRLLEGVGEKVLEFDISGKYYLVQELQKVINKIYGD
jgi:hypothetical protein